jgi:hypothetical protein
MRILFDHRIPRFHPQNPRSLGFAPPDFLLRFVALANFMRLSLRGKAHTQPCPAQRGRKSGSDDKRKRQLVHKEWLLTEAFFKFANEHIFCRLTLLIPNKPKVTPGL